MSDAAAESAPDRARPRAATKALALSADVQAIANPGFNRDRGPVVLLALRAHLEL